MCFMSLLKQKTYGLWNSKQTVMKTKLSIALLSFATFSAFVIFIVFNLYPIIHDENNNSQESFAPDHQHIKQDSRTKKHHKSKEVIHERIQKGKA